MSKKRIDFYCSTFLTGGIETTLIQLLKNINPDLFILRLVVLFKTPKLELLISQIPENVEVLYIVPSDILNRVRARRLKERIPLHLKVLEEVFLLNIRRVIFHYNIRKEIAKADVIIDYGMCLMDYPNLIKKKKSVIYNHFSLNHINRSNPKKNLKLVNSLTNYTKVIAICDEMVEQFLNFFPSRRDMIDRIYNYVNGVDILKRASEGTLSFNKPFILAIGRLDETQKDYTTLLKGYAIARKEYSIDQDLVILGQGRDKEKLINLCNDLDILSFVHFMGFDDNPYKWIKRCDFFVHSSKFEGLPTVIIEAMILGKCVVASKCPTGVKELLFNGKAGLLFEIGNYRELALDLKEMASNSDLKETFLTNGQSVLEQFTHINTIQRLERELLLM